MAYRRRYRRRKGFFQRISLNNLLILINVIVFAVIFPIGYLYAFTPQEEITELFSEKFFTLALGLSASVMGYSQFLKTLLTNYFGKLHQRVVQTVPLVVGMAIGYFQFKDVMDSWQGIVIGFIAGGISSGAYVAAKQTKRIPGGGK